MMHTVLHTISFLPLRSLCPFRGLSLSPVQCELLCGVLHPTTFTCCNHLPESIKCLFALCNTPPTGYRAIVPRCSSRVRSSTWHINHFGGKDASAAAAASMPPSVFSFYVASRKWVALAVRAPLTLSSYMYAPPASHCPLRPYP